MMAGGGTYFSSESDEYYLPSSRQRRHPHDMGDTDPRVQELTANLQDTTRNLRSLDRMLDNYRSVGDERRSAVDRLRVDLDRTHEDIREERYREALYERDYGSDNDSPSSNTKRKRKASVRFADDMNRELHGIHQSVRDLSSEQLKLEESFNREMERRDRYDIDTKHSLRDITESMKKMTPTDSIDNRVERRLLQIQNELRTDRMASERHDDLGTLSSELRNAVQQQQQLPMLIDERIRSQYLHAETQKHKIESELDGVKRRLDQSEGSRTALQQQVEDLRSQLMRADQERTRFKMKMEEARLEDEIRDKRKRRTMDEDDGRRGVEREIQELRGQLARSVGAITELDELRRAVEKSERQRAQLSDHIETLTKDLENREKQNAKLITELKATGDRLDDTERHRLLINTQLEDVVQRLRDTSRELEKTSNELKNTQLSLHESEKKKDEFKTRAQDTVRQWKMKVKQLERDLDRQKHAWKQMMQRNEQLVKDMEGSRHQSSNTVIHMESLKRELGDALAVRAAQDEQIRLKDIEVNELKSLRIDLEKELRDLRTVADRMENELHSLRSRSADVSSDRHRLEDKLSAVEAAHLLAQDQANQLQIELKELSTVKADLAGQHAQATAKVHDLKQKVVELQHREKAAKEEGELYKRQLFQERSGHQHGMESIKIELNEAKVREAHTMHEVSRRFKRDHVEYEATIQALKLELSEEKSACKIAKRNEDKWKQEVDRLTAQLTKYEEDNAKLIHRLELVKQEFETQASFGSDLFSVSTVTQNHTHLAEDDISRVRRLDDQLVAAQAELKRLEDQQTHIVQEMALEVEAVLEAGKMDAVSKYQPINGLTKGAKTIMYLVTEMKGKLKWMRMELRDRILREQRLRQEFRQALTSTDMDRKFLLAELAKRDEELDDIAAAKQELAFKEVESKNAVESLEEHILDLADELHLQKVKQVEQELTFEREKQYIIEDMEEIMGGQQERDLIEKRYNRLRETMRSLHEDIKSTGCSSYQSGNLRPTSILRSSTPTGSPKKKNHVRILDSPPTLDRPLRSRSPSRSRSRSSSRSPRRSTSLSPHRSSSRSPIPTLAGQVGDLRPGPAASTPAGATP
ncbi:centrosomal protein of 128 kDa-like isoform X3 [Haliotis cracherodii]|uniref:centrosomal protein of 128 kDa-like isoform X3 n=1 Tax=Haliotis cracherodii TaxID=6455 RepID=UPI0039EB13F4